MKSLERGTTLMEIIVVLALFAILLSVIATMVKTVIEYQRQATEKGEVMHQVHYALEFIAREARTAHIDTTGNCLGAGFAGNIYRLTHYDMAKNFYQGIVFLNQEGICYEFYYDQLGGFKKRESGGVADNLISDKLNISSVSFVLDGDRNRETAPQNASIQPRVTMVFHVITHTNLGEKVNIFQTTISRNNRIEGNGFPSPSVCGNGICEAGETCASGLPIPVSTECTVDCGMCPGLIGPPVTL